MPIVYWYNKLTSSYIYFTLPKSPHIIARSILADASVGRDTQNYYLNFNRYVYILQFRAKSRKKLIHIEWLQFQSKDNDFLLWKHSRRNQNNQAHLPQNPPLNRQQPRLQKKKPPLPPIPARIPQSKSRLLSSGTRYTAAPIYALA